MEKIPRRGKEKALADFDEEKRRIAEKYRKIVRGAKKSFNKLAIKTEAFSASSNEDQQQKELLRIKKSAARILSALETQLSAGSLERVHSKIELAENIELIDGLLAEMARYLERLSALTSQVH